MNVNLGIWSKLTRMVVFLLVVAGILGVCVLYKPVIQNNENLRKDIIKLDGLVRLADQENHRLESAIKALQQDPRTVERVAREKLNLARPGETVILFKDLPPSAPSAPAPKPYGAPAHFPAVKQP